MKIRAYLMMFVFLSLAACADKSSESAQASGNCSEATIDAYNGVMDKYENYRDTRKYTDLKALLNQCAVFKNFIGGQSCSATNTTTKAEVTVTKDSRHCQDAEAKMASLKATQNEVIPAPSETTSTPKNKPRKKK